MMQSANTSNPLVGAWKLISFQFESEGTDERFDAYDKHPQPAFAACWSNAATIIARTTSLPARTPGLMKSGRPTLSPRFICTA